MAPATLLSIPETILEDIIAFSLRRPTATDCPRFYSRQRPGVKKPIPAILLASKRLSTIALRLLYSRTQFHLKHLSAVEAFLDLIGSDNLANLRHILMDLVLANPNDFKRFSDILFRLPVSLRNLCLRLQFFPPTWERRDGTPLSLRTAIQRFATLEHMGIIFDVPTWGFVVTEDRSQIADRIEMVQQQASVLFATPFQCSEGQQIAGNEIHTPFCTPFRYLKFLQLTGYFKVRSSELDIFEALNEEHLPSLEELYLSIQTESFTDLDVSVSAESLLSMHPLKVLSWSVEPEVPVTTFCDRHIIALVQKHSQTLQRLTIDTFGTKSDRWPLTGSGIEKLVTSCPNIRRFFLSKCSVDALDILKAISMAASKELRTLYVQAKCRFEDLDTALSGTKYPQLLGSPPFCTLDLSLDIETEGTIAFPLPDGDVPEEIIEVHRKLEQRIVDYIEQGAKAHGIEMSTWRRTEVLVFPG